MIGFFLGSSPITWAVVSFTSSQRYSYVECWRYTSVFMKKGTPASLRRTVSAAKPLLSTRRARLQARSDEIAASAPTTAIGTNARRADALMRPPSVGVTGTTAGGRAGGARAHDYSKGWLI